MFRPTFQFSGQKIHFIAEQSSRHQYNEDVIRANPSRRSFSARESTMKSSVDRSLKFQVLVVCEVVEVVEGRVVLK